MSDHSRVVHQIRHYRELADIAKHCAGKSKHNHSEYLDLAKGWLALAESLEERVLKT